MKDDNISEMNDAIEEVLSKAGAQTDGTDGVSFAATVKGLPGKITKVMSGLFEGPTGQQMFQIYAQTSKELLLQRLGNVLLDVTWAAVQKNTAEMAKSNRAIHYAFHTSMGKAASTFLVCQVGAWAFIYLAEYFKVRGDTEKAKFARLLATVLTYSTGNGVMNALNISGMISAAMDGVSNLCAKNDINLNELMAEDK